MENIIKQLPSKVIEDLNKQQKKRESINKLRLKLYNEILECMKRFKPFKRFKLGNLYYEDPKGNLIEKYELYSKSIYLVNKKFNIDHFIFSFLLTIIMSFGLLLIFSGLTITFNFSSGLLLYFLYPLYIGLCLAFFFFIFKILNKTRNCYCDDLDYSYFYHGLPRHSCNTEKSISKTRASITEYIQKYHKDGFMEVIDYE